MLNKAVMAICNYHDFFPETFVKVFVNSLDFYPKIFRIRDNLSHVRICHFRTYFGSTESIYLQRHPWSRQLKGPFKKRKKNLIEKCCNFLKQTFPETLATNRK